MNVLLVFAVIGVLAWWIRHHQLYTSGAVKTPFFSLGGSAPRQTVRRRSQSSKSGRRKVVLRATPAAMENAVRKISTYTHNEDVSARLLHYTRLSNTSKSLDWCAEKVVEDILRDRR